MILYSNSGTSVESIRIGGQMMFAAVCDCGRSDGSTNAEKVFKELFSRKLTIGGGGEGDPPWN